MFRTEDGGTGEGEVTATSAFKVQVTIQYADGIWGHWISRLDILSLMEVN